MKIYIYLDGNTVVCELHQRTRHSELQVIEAEETDLPITEDWAGIGIEVGEVFSCNDVVSNLIRVA